MNKSENSIRILVFYNKEDKNFYDKLKVHVRSLERSIKLAITISCDQSIQAGEDWNGEFESYFDNAHIILLLISANFQSAPHYNEEIKKVLQTREKQKTRVIPIILHPVPWKTSPIGFLQALPTEDRPISHKSSWSSQNEAFHDVSEGLRDIIQQLLKERGLEDLDEDESELDDTPMSATVFDWAGRIAPFSYLTFSGRDLDGDVSRQTRLRMIMRVFYEHQNDSHGSLSEQEICERVQEKIKHDYDIQDCREDLKYLKDHFNLVRIDDISSMAHSISAFNELLERKSYEITPDGFEIEHFIEGRINSSRGRLSKNDLRDIKKHLLEIDEYLKKPELREVDIDDIADKWVSVFKTWNEVRASSRNYFSALERNAQYGQYDFEKFMEYKNTVTNYVRSFADTLMDISHEINELFSSWSQQKKARLINSIAQHVSTKDPDLEKRPSLEMAVELVRDQVTSLEVWFKDKAHVFYERARSEIHRLVNRATALALYRRSHINNVTALEQLALQFLHIYDAKSAQQMFDAAFGHVLPMHLVESLAGQVQMYERPEEASTVWDEPPPARPSLTPAKPKKASPSSDTPVQRSDNPELEDMRESYRLQAEVKQQEAERQQRFDRLFAQCSLDLSSLPLIDPLDRAILEKVIDKCLNHPASRFEDESGNVVLLLNRDEQKYIYLCSSDGSLFLPSYQLLLQKSPLYDDQ